MHIWFIFALSFLTILAFPTNVPIGALFKFNKLTETAFLSSIKDINSRYNKNNMFGININTIYYQNSSDILDISYKACNLFQKGISAIFGNLDRITSLYIQSMCDVMEIPYITMQWDPYQERGKSINLYPYADVLAKIYYLIIKEMKWKSYTLIYDSTNSLIRLKIALKKLNTRNFPITFYRIDNETNYRYILKNIKESGEKNIVIDCSYDILENLLYQTLQVGIMSDKFNLFITSMDLHTINLNLFQYSGVNLTGIRLIKPENIIAINNLILNERLDFGIENPNEILTEQALIYDAVQLFAEGFSRLKYATKGDIKEINCKDIETWEYGISLNNFIKSVEVKGLTGLITFDNAGFRTNFEIEIFKLTYEGIKVVGNWNSTRNIEWIINSSHGIPVDTLSLRNTTFKVLIALTRPYGMLKETVFKMSGNDQYEGFAIDIIHEISKMLGFNYTFSVQTDNNYGSLNRETGHWDGMLKKIIDSEADLAITDLTITAERETAVDFTMPFMNLGISILYQKPKAAPPSLMSFLLPFSANVWLYLIGVYLIVSALFFIIGRMCPAEWNNIYPCIEEPDQLENQFTIKNSLWFCIGAIMQQGSEIAPIGNSTRMLAGCWWFFCLIIVSSYTANLAAFLTVETVERPIKSAEDLANQNIIKYGAKKGGSTLGFFKDTNSSTYSKMYQYMIDNAKDVLTSDNDEGKKKVLNENYAFLMESSSIDYIQERECNLSQIGGLLDQKGYGIAMKKNASYRNELSGAVLKLQEMGVLTALKNKWWKEKSGGGRCQEDSGGGQAEELGLANVGGVFLVLIVGVALSFFGTIFEFIYNLIMNSRRNKVNLRNKLNHELKFIFKLGISTKPLKQQEN